LRYPIYIDTQRPEGGVGFGAMSSALMIRGIPQAALIDQNGRIVAIGRLEEVLGRAQGLVRSSD
jgi:hypothetical protein